MSDNTFAVGYNWDAIIPVKLEAGYDSQNNLSSNLIFTFSERNEWSLLMKISLMQFYGVVGGCQCFTMQE